MPDILDEAQSVLQCKICPWYKMCVLPMRFTEEDIKKQLESASGAGAGASAYGMQQLLSGMASAAQNTLLEGCPVFIGRLRSSPRLAQRIKKLMLDWDGSEEAKSS